MVGYNYSGMDLAATRRHAIEQCAKIAEEIAAKTGDGEGEIYLAAKIAEKIRELLPKSEDQNTGFLGIYETPKQSS